MIEEIKKITKELKDIYGINFDIDEKYPYEIEDDMDNIKSLFSRLEDELEKLDMQ